MVRRNRIEWALLVVLAGVALAAYSWRLNSNGWANAYYSVVAWSGGQSWRSMFFGSLEPFDVVSTDKPPLSFWLPALSVRVFGLHPWSLVLPQALLTVAAVVLLARIVRRAAGRLAGLVAAGAYAATPVVAALARANEPEPLLVVFTLLTGYAVVRVAQGGGRRWLVLAGLGLGCAFLTKWAMGWLVAPGVLWALWPVLRGRRLRAGGLLVVMTLVSGLWWVAVLAVLGPERRPFPDSPHGSLLDLVVGQNGVSRLAGAGGGAISGTPGPLRLLIPPFADQIGWFLPAALVLLGWLGWRRHGSVVERAAVRLFGGWMLTLVVLFSAMGGAMHPYYTAYLAPAIAAVLGIGLAAAWRDGYRILLAVVLAGSAGYCGWVTYAVGLSAWTTAVALAAGTSGAVIVALAPRRWVGAGCALVAAGLLTGPVVTCAGTLSHPMVGANPRAGWHNHARSDPYPVALTDFLAARQGGADWVAAAPQGTPAAVLSLQMQRPVLPLGGFTGTGAEPTPAQLETFMAARRLRYVVLIGRYTHHRDDTPRSLRGTPLAATVDWARTTGCPVTVAGVRVIDLWDRACHLSTGQ